MTPKEKASDAGVYSPAAAEADSKGAVLVPAESSLRTRKAKN
jgi:hypothetical protein